MPPKARITKQMVADASFDVIRKDGHEKLNARTIARHLGCSTQPVLYGFGTVDEIRRAAYKIADEYHTAYILPAETDKDPMLALGLNYIRFGHEEKNLFRFLFQTDQFGGMDAEAILRDPNLPPVLEVMAKKMHCGADKTRETFLAFFGIAHGLASLLANNSMQYDEELCRKLLENVFWGLTAVRKGTEHAQNG